MKRYKKDKNKESLASALPALIRDKGWEKQIDLYSIFTDWGKIVDATTAAHTRPLKIVREILWVAVDNSSWVHQLRFEKLSILEQVNAVLKLSRIKDIKFTVAEKPQDTDQKAKKKVAFSPVDPLELASFEDQAGLIEDEASRKALVRLWYLYKACRRE
jgi:predicted nucleic acid-binding Zn ribbon protein